jgi:hypothetical protein
MFEDVKDIIKGVRPLGSRRSSLWPEVRDEHLSKYACCEVCAATSKLRVHHIKPYHLFPELELEKSNLITLCESWKMGLNCHLLVGHLGNYRNINPDCVSDAKYWSEKLAKKEFRKELEYQMYFKGN